MTQTYATSRPGMGRSMTNGEGISPLPSTVAAPVELPAYDVRDIVQGGDQARLILDGQTYLLRITRAGKLILTK